MKGKIQAVTKLLVVEGAIHQTSDEERKQIVLVYEDVTVRITKWNVLIFMFLFINFKQLIHLDLKNITVRWAIFKSNKSGQRF